MYTHSLSLSLSLSLPLLFFYISPSLSLSWVWLSSRGISLLDGFMMLRVYVFRALQLGNGPGSKPLL